MTCATVPANVTRLSDDVALVASSLYRLSISAQTHQVRA
jgi:hypothetical protein